MQIKPIEHDIKQVLNATSTATFPDPNVSVFLTVNDGNERASDRDDSEGLITAEKPSVRIIDVASDRDAAKDAASSRYRLPVADAQRIGLGASRVKQCGLEWGGRFAQMTDEDATAIASVASVLLHHRLKMPDTSNDSLRNAIPESNRPGSAGRFNYRFCKALARVSELRGQE
jgi:hypothetical protein